MADALYMVRPKWLPEVGETVQVRGLDRPEEAPSRLRGYVGQMATVVRRMGMGMVRVRFEDNFEISIPTKFLKRGKEENASTDTEENLHSGG